MRSAAAASNHPRKVWNDEMTNRRDPLADDIAAVGAANRQESCPWTAFLLLLAKSLRDGPCRSRSLAPCTCTCPVTETATLSEPIRTLPPPEHTAHNAVDRWFKADIRVAKRCVAILTFPIVISLAPFYHSLSHVRWPIRFFSKNKRCHVLFDCPLCISRPMGNYLTGSERRLKFVSM